MKKFYTLLVATAATVLAANAEVTLVSNGLSEASAQRILNTEYVAPATDSPLKTAPAGKYNVVGEGTVTAGILSTLLPENCTPGQSWAITIEQSANNQAWYRTQLYNENSPLMEVLGEPDQAYFYFNVADPNKVYSDNFLIGGIYSVFQFCIESGLYDHLTDKGKEYLSNNQRYGKLENGVIAFPMESFWAIQEGENSFTTTNFYATLTITMPGTEFKPVWRELGKGDFSDGFFAPHFVSDCWHEFINAEGKEDTWFSPFISEVNISRHNFYPNLYRVNDPWFSWLESTYPLVLDASIADFVIIPGQETGLRTQAEGTWQMMSFSGNATGCSTREEQASQPDAWITTAFITLENNKFNIAPNAIGIQHPEGDSPNSIYAYNVPNEDGDNLSSYITIPEEAGVNDVVVSDDSNAPAEYYNLQGVRVNNPANGLYIVKKGNKAYKIFVR